MRQGREAAVLGLVQFLIVALENSEIPIEHLCRKAAIAANDVIYRRMRGGGGTTLSAVILQRHREPVFAHAGDSRAYLIRSQKEPEQVSRDDTLRAVLNKPIEDHEEFGSKLIQFVGMGEGFDPHVFRSPSHSDFVLLTSDGVHGVAQSTLSRTVRAAAGPSDLVRRLLQLSDILGGWDNATAVTLPSRLDSPSEAQPGCFLSFLTSTELFEVWLTDRLTGTYQANTGTSRETGASRPAAPAIAPKELGPAKKSPQKGKSSKTRKQQKQKDVPLEQLELKPQPPVVSVEFPDSKVQGEPS